MAFGKPPEIKALKTAPTVEDQLWRSNVRAEEIASEAWKTKWGWILTEYSNLQAKLNEASATSEILQDLQFASKPDTRNLKPYPKATSNDYGWVGTRPEFKLEKYGPDYYKGMPLVNLYP